MPGHLLVAAALAVAVLDWVAVGRGNRRAEYLLKPLTLAVLLAAAVALRAGDPPPRVAWTVAALALSLVGDVLLMLPGRFLAGLAAFLAAHLAYVAAFTSSAPPILPTLPAAAIVVLVAAAVFVRLRAGIAVRGSSTLVAAVALYVIAISAMVVSAVSTLGRGDWPTARAAVAVAGALLFYASDAMIGWTRFVRDFPHSRVWIMVTYHLGQVGLVLGLLG